MFVVVLVTIKSPRIIAHEQAHIRQQWAAGPARFLWRYFVQHWRGDSRWRIDYEAEAYAESVRLGLSITTASRLLARFYGLRLSERSARDHIKRFLDHGATTATPSARR